VRIVDVLLGDVALYRRLRGGRWQRRTATAVLPFEWWERVELFLPKLRPAVIAREDYR